MPDDMIIARTETYVRARHMGDASGHDWWHVDRVRRLALRISEAEGGDLVVVELAALLHDVADWKLHHGNEAAGRHEVSAWLTGLALEREVVRHVTEITARVSFLGAGVAAPMPTREGRIVQDADRLDAIGAIGIARAFAFGGARGRPLHDPAVPPRLHATATEYKASAGPTLNHFGEKLLLLQERLHTDTARRIAAERHRFMEEFLARFHDEWEGRG